MKMKNIEEEEEDGGASSDSRMDKRVSTDI